ncbi:MAG: hypothetical protein GY855_07410 [candidate division Zixibacteria bacterium]|nr:hypothetical protein [candidate division Zixibacteria bacterium]
MDLSISAIGIQKGFKILEQSAQKLSNPELRQIEEAFVEQSKAKVTIGANIAALKTALEMQESIIDLFA